MTRKHVLIVGEDDLIAWAIRKRFSAMQIPVRVVRTPREALEALPEAPYSLVVFEPGLLERDDPAIPAEFRRASGAEITAHLPGGATAGNRQDPGPPSEIRFVTKPLTIFDLDRVVEGVAGTFSEKRGDPRGTCNIPLSIFIEEEGGSGKTIGQGHPTGVAADASEDGLRVFTSHLLVPGQRLRLSPLPVAGHREPIIRWDRVAEVVWVVPDEEGVIAGLRYLD